MEQYECINTFTATNKEYYARGMKIYLKEYLKLSSFERANFQEIRSDLEEFESPKSKDARFADLQDDGKYNTSSAEKFLDAIGDAIAGLNSDTTQEDKGDLEFGEGSGGGAGASDDW
jgi:hypothetical protein